MIMENADGSPRHYHCNVMEEQSGYTVAKLFCVLAISSILLASCGQVQQTESFENNSSLKPYTEKHRPQIHFSPKTSWMNDPNGMFYYNNKYHLFYQYYPDSTVWGPMHWGHAESTDMIRWKELPIALYPDSLGYIFSGGAVVDHQNTSGFGTSTIPPVVATFTHHDIKGEQAKTLDFQYQSMAYSLDEGATWSKYEGNPIIPNTEKIKDFRDPKVVWHKGSKQWILVLAAYDRVKFYVSPNLLDWQFLSDFGIEGDDRLWECPDLFPMKVEGSTEEKWVLLVSIQKKAPNEGTATSYFIGDFDGKEFKMEKNGQQWLDWGTDNYAFVTWNNIPEADGRTMGIGWMSNWQYAQIVPTTTWRSAMTLPRELQLHRKDSGYRLQSLPVRELQTLRSDSVALKVTELSGNHVLEAATVAPIEVELTIDLEHSTAETFGFQLYNDVGELLVVTIDKKAQRILVDRTKSSENTFSKEFYERVHSAPIALNKKELKLHFFIDQASLELFDADGELGFTTIFFPTEVYSGMALFSNNGNCNVVNGKVYYLKSIWD